MEFSPLIIVGLFFVALLAGLVDAIAGGGGLLTVPALLATGMPTPMVFGTNKGSAVFGSGAALLRFWRAKLIDSKRAKVLFPLGMLGSFAGVALLTALDPKVLKPLVLILLVVAGFVVAFVRPPAVQTGVPSPRAGVKTAFLALFLGAYDGFFGPGTGTFLIIGFVVLRHLTLQEASANAKVVNFASNLAAMLFLTWKGFVIWKVSIPMAAGQFIGGTLGAHLAVRGGDTLVRRVVLLVVLALVTKLGYELMHTP
ncbi:MAG: TSUP family transporter [Archangium sp.]|nr:TSUP family transporter [Archangium sp.]MDP3573815.1 TSUP family transporter [Archangium sp.]